MRLLFSSTFVLTAVALFGSGSAAAVIPQGTTNTDTNWTADKPLTGRAIPCMGGRVMIFECHNVELLSYLPQDSIGQSAGYDLWGWHDSTTGREFVVIGGASTAFVEVTDPINPKYLGVLPPHGGGTKHAAQSVKVYKHYALIGYESADYGLQVFDLTQLRDLKTMPTEFRETGHYSRLTSTHTITMNQKTGFAYANGSNTCGGGLHMIDMRISTTPTFVGCYTEPNVGMFLKGYIHDAQCVIYRGPDRKYQGREICVNAAETAISIADVTDKQHLKTIGIATYPNVGYAHQGWLTENHRYFFVNDEMDEQPAVAAAMKSMRPIPDAQQRPPTLPTRTIVFDMSDLGDPVVLTEFHAKTDATDHNLYIRNKYMYQANYTAGLRIIDVSDPQKPKEVGYLDTTPQLTGPSMTGAWTNYPFFKNDVVAVSTSKGLVLARLLTR